MAETSDMEPKSKIITVDARGSAETPPDRASVEVGVSVLAKSVRAASDRAANDITAMQDALRGLGVERADTRTTAHSVRPEYDHSGRSRRLAGYRVVNALQVTIRSVERLGVIIDAVTEAGGDNVTVERIHFELEDPTALEAEARERAWHNAVAKAAQLAELAGVGLGPAVSIRESTGRRPDPVVPHRAAAMAAPVDTPIEGGTLAIDVALTISFSID